MCDGEGKEYIPIESLDKKDQTDLNNLEKTLHNKPYINGTIISIADIETLDNLDLLNININQTNFPNIYKWKKEIERMKLNWRISKKPATVKGKTFKQYIKIMTDKVTKKNEEYSLQIKNDMKIHENILKPEIKENEKEIATINFFKKNDGEKEYIVKILVKFFTDSNMSYKDLAPKISIICHNHLPNKTEVQEYKESNDGDKFINVLITSIVNSEEYNIEKLSQELKRNINGIATVNILSLNKK